MCISEKGALKVRHRIDDLEKSAVASLSITCVRHRIDDLEKNPKTHVLMTQVRHRIDDLENTTSATG